MDDTGEIQA